MLEGQRETSRVDFYLYKLCNRRCVNALKELIDIPKCHNIFATQAGSISSFVTSHAKDR